MNRNMISDQPFGRARPAPQPSVGAATATAAAATAPLLLMIFIFSIPPPMYFFVGGTLLSVTRLVLLVLFIPLAVRLFSGAAGRIRTIDIFMFLFSGWMGIVLLYHGGMAQLPLAAMTVVEMLGGYLIGRTLVLNVTDYRLFVRCLLLALLILLPFSVLEFFTNVSLLGDIFGTVFNKYDKPLTQSWRNGFARVASGFEHPILYGMFCAITVAPIYYLYRDKWVRAICCIVLVLAMTYMSLSSAPVIAAVICILLIIWDHVTKSRWKPLVWLFISIYIFLSIASNRGPIILMIEYLTFDAHTAWTRVNTFKYGSVEVMNHPFLGMGLFIDWQRPAWLTESVDNFWLVIAMRYGLTGIILLALALGAGIWAVTQAKNLDPITTACRTGYVIALTGLYFSLTTVHIWGDTSSFLMCFIGAGIWLSAAGTPGAQATEPPSDGIRRQPVPSRPQTAPTLHTPSAARGLPTTRFAQHHARPNRTQSPSVEHPPHRGLNR